MVSLARVLVASNCQTRDTSWNINESIPVPRPPFDLFDIPLEFRGPRKILPRSSVNEGEMSADTRLILVDGPPSERVDRNPVFQ